MGNLRLIHVAILLAACPALPHGVSAQATKQAADSATLLRTPREAPSGRDGVVNMLDKCVMIAGAEFYVAIDNKGNWPNLVTLPKGEIGAFIYNHPSHGFGCGDIELWISADGGRLWTFRSKVSDHSDAPGRVRMNHAVGFNPKGELVVVVSGWSEGRKRPKLPVQICISSDGGHKWQRHELPVDDVPFGKIICTPDGTLTSVWYNKDRANLYASRDGGHTWQLSHTLPWHRRYHMGVMRYRLEDLGKADKGW